MTERAIDRMIVWLEEMREKSREETKRGQVLAFAHAADKARHLAQEEKSHKAEVDPTAKPIEEGCVVLSCPRCSSGVEYLCRGCDSLLMACKNTLAQLERTYEKGNPATEGLCLSIRGLRAAILNYGKSHKADCPYCGGHGAMLNGVVCPEIKAHKEEAKPTKCQYWEMGAFAPKCFHPGQESPDGFECPHNTDGECTIIQHKADAPASLVEELNKLIAVYKNSPTHEGFFIETTELLSRYRPTPQADILGELKAYCADKPDEAHHMGLCEYNNESGNRVKEEIEEIIRKFEGGVK